MPNWCENSLNVNGPAKELALFVSKVREGDGLLSSVFPRPESLDLTHGSTNLCYHVYYGEIPEYVWGWDHVVESGIDKNDPDVKEKLISYLTEKDKNFSKELADKYKYNVDTHGFMDWYNWSIANWGTKWDVPHKDTRPGEFKDGDKDYDVCFDTAWGPPLEWMERVSLDYPKLTFLMEYYELGMWFAGYLKIKDGNTVSKLEGEPDQQDSKGDPLFDFCAEYAEQMMEENGE